MSRYLIIPDRDRMDETIALCREYNLGLELNDFMFPKVLDDEARCRNLCEFYKNYSDYVCTSHGDFFDVLVFSEDPRIAAISKERIIQSLNVSRAAGATGVIFHSNIEPFLNSVEYKENWLNKNESVFREICSRFPYMNIYLENMFDMKPNDLADLGERMKDVANFGICFDYSHAFISSVPLSTWAKALSPYIKHVHINDNDGINDLHLAVGDGTIDWEMFAKLKDMYFNDTTILIETSSIEYQKKSIEFLKGVTDI